MASTERTNNVSQVQFLHAGAKASAEGSAARKRRQSIHLDTESYTSDAGNGVRDSDFRKRQTFKGWTLIWLAYQATGVIYGDIGTSPLYVYSSTFSSEPEYQELLGALSLIIWSITLIVTVKYVCIVLRADDEGEGGTFAIYTLLSRYCNLVKRDPRANNLVKMERYATNDIGTSNRGIRDWLEKSSIAHAILKILAVFGVSLIMADGILTPAQSVLGAIQGLKVVRPDITTGTIVGLSCAILIALFLVQPLGIHRISSVFAPVVIIWLLFNASFGIYNLVIYDWRVLKAFSPFFAGDWFMRNGTQGWFDLGGILLCFTGVEALFADLGAFSRGAIQLSWLVLAYPCLLLAYTGQAAYIARDPSAYSNPFFNTVPPGMFYPSLVMAILAAIVASQALITSMFQLLSQVMHSSYFPHIQMIYTSDKFYGQVYIPIANWLMMIGTVIVTAVYNNTTSLGHAYGFCVIFVTFVTTNLVTLVAVIVWRLHPALVFAVWLPFVTLDGLFLSSSVTKLPRGAWFTLVLAVALASFLTLWRYGKVKQWSMESANRGDLSDFFVKRAEGNGVTLSDKHGGGALAKIEGFAIFFDKEGQRTPMVYEQWLRKFRAQMGVVVLMHLRALSVPSVPEEERYAVSRTSVQNVYRLTIRHGYNDRVITPDLAETIYLQVRRTLVQSSVVRSASSEVSRDTVADSNQCEHAITSALDARSTALAAQIEHLDRSYRTQSLYLVGKEQMRIRAEYSVPKRMVLGMFLWVRDNCRSRIAKLNVPVERLVEVGFVGDI